MKPSGRVFKNKDSEPRPDATFFFWKGVGALLVLLLEEIKRVRGKKKRGFIRVRACLRRAPELIY